MQFDLNLVLPQTFDVVHIGLAALSLILLIIALLRGASNKPAGVPDAEDGAANPKPQAPEQSFPKLEQANNASALQLLGLFQQEARLLDFFQEDLSNFDDSDIGAAARVVHAGGKKVLQEYFELAAVQNNAEESQVTIEAGFNTQAIRLTGNVVGEAPFTGTLVHKGWQATRTNLPKLAKEHDASIIAAAEIEL